ncbi:hypothetical protein [Rhizosaccharibacter radicis]|uniref:Uncharacterized protein n=1 Tax=Rhizosaccharibacter radicis TaxID=2782605 RepID=A0ABT1VVU6_9PROT|nr:hypothetical protein [Acetobacteraceae bacterium KSS12]
MPCASILLVGLEILAAWQMLSLLTLRVLLLPLLAGFGLLALGRLLLPGALLVGAAAVRWPSSRAGAMLAAFLAVGGELVILRLGAGSGWLMHALGWAMPRWQRELFATVLPLLSGVLACRLLPFGMLRRLLRVPPPTDSC